MLFKHRKFNHDAGKMDEALDIPEEIKNIAVEKIIFSTMSNALFGAEMYDDENERPAELRTVTGDLQKTLKMVDDPLEYEYVLFKFNHYHELVQTVMGLHKSINGKASDPETRMKNKILHQLINVVDPDMSEANPGKISFRNMYQRIEMVKKSRYNFAKYLTILGLEQGVDDMLNFLRDED